MEPWMTIICGYCLMLLHKEIFIFVLHLLYPNSRVGGTIGMGLSIGLFVLLFIGLPISPCGCRSVILCGFCAFPGKPLVGSQIWWIHISLPSSGLNSFWSRSIAFSPYPGIPLVQQLIFVHLWTDNRLDSSQIRWASPDLINLWSCFTEFPVFRGVWLVEQFPWICRQTTEQIGPKFGGTTHQGYCLAWVTFGHAPMIFCHFLAYKLLIRSGSEWWTDSLWALFPRCSK